MFPNKSSNPFAQQPQGSPSTMLQSPVLPPPKSKKKMIIRIATIVGGIGIITGIVVLLMTHVFNGGTIGSVEEFKEAIENRRAINCWVTMDSGIPEDDIRMLIQTNDGWSRIRTQQPAFDNELNVITIKDDFQYLWVEGNSSGNKYRGVLSMIEFTNFDSVRNVECQPNGRANFSVPRQVEFIERESEPMPDLEFDFDEQY